MDYEVEYNNRARVPENPAIIAGWARDAKAYREAHQGRLKVISYGSGERHRIDLFSGDGTGPIVVFIHGGYWQALDGSFFSHLAGGLNAHGVDVAVPSYDLCPTVSVGDIVEQMRAASRELAKLGRPLVVSGHSAGGHLAACMLATDWRALDRSLPEGLVTAAYAISGLFDLRPLVPTSINNALKLDDAVGEGGEPLVLATAGARHPRCRGRRQRERRIFPPEQDHRRCLGRGGYCDTVCYDPGRQPFHRDRAAGRSEFADDAAAEAAGRALGPVAAFPKPVEWPNFTLAPNYFKPKMI